MSLSKKILLGIGLILLALFIWAMAERRLAQKRLANYRQQMTARGEKLGFAELAPRPPTGENGAPRLIAAAGRLVPSSSELPAVAMKMVASGAARVAWKEEQPFDFNAGVKTNCWPFLREQMETNQAHLMEIREALQAPAFHVALDYSGGFGTLLPHLVPIKSAETWLAAAALTDMQEGRSYEAFENVRACAVLPVLYEGEPIMISQLVRIACVYIGFAATWEALQFNAWSDEQWQELQQLWQRMDFIPQLESSLAMERAWGILAFPEGRKKFPQHYLATPPANPISEFMEYATGVFDNPVTGLKEITGRYPGYWVWIGWWSYDDEIALCNFWQLGIDASRTVEKQRSFGEAIKNLEKAENRYKGQIPSHYLITSQVDFPQHGFFKRIAQAQNMKEMMATAIALKRFELRHQKSPSHLSELIPDFLAGLPHDYFSGEPLKYRLNADGTFLLYSVGENGVDDGGNSSAEDGSGSWALSSSLDWVWPRPATAAEVKAYEAERTANRFGTPVP